METLPRLPHTWWGEVIRIFGGPLGLLIPHPTGKALAALFNIALSLFFFQDKPMPFHKTILAFGISYALAVLFLRITGVVRWHALEHKSAHVLEDIWRGRLALTHLSENSLVQALERASPLHPWCGSLYMVTRQPAHRPFPPLNQGSRLGILYWSHGHQVQPLHG